MLVYECNFSILEVDVGVLGVVGYFRLLSMFEVSLG